jgi:hypothetical protein
MEMKGLHMWFIVVERVRLIWRFSQVILFNAYNTKPDANGNITVTFSVEDPKDGTYWMPVNAGEPYYFVARYYKPDVDKLPPKPCR